MKKFISSLVMVILIYGCVASQSTSNADLVNHTGIAEDKVSNIYRDKLSRITIEPELEGHDNNVEESDLLTIGILKENVEYAIQNGYTYDMLYEAYSLLKTDADKMSFVSLLNRDYNSLFSKDPSTYSTNLLSLTTDFVSRVIINGMKEEDLSEVSKVANALSLATVNYVASAQYKHTLNLADMLELDLYKLTMNAYTDTEYDVDEASLYWDTYHALGLFELILYANVNEANLTNNILIESDPRSIVTSKTELMNFGCVIENLQFHILDGFKFEGKYKRAYRYTSNFASLDDLHLLDSKFGPIMIFIPTQAQNEALNYSSSIVHEEQDESKKMQKKILTFFGNRPKYILDKEEHISSSRNIPDYERMYLLGEISRNGLLSVNSFAEKTKMNLYKKLGGLIGDSKKQILFIQEEMRQSNFQLSEDEIKAVQAIVFGPSKDGETLSYDFILLEGEGIYSGDSWKKIIEGVNQVLKDSDDGIKDALYKVYLDEQILVQKREKESK